MKPKTVNIAIAKATLPALIERAARGETVILARDGKPRARLMPLPRIDLKLRTPGKGKGRFVMSTDFSSPLPKAIQSLFEK